MDKNKRMYNGYCEERKGPNRNHSAVHMQPLERNAFGLHECWNLDFVTDWLYDGSRFRELTVVDNFSRKCSIHVGKSLKGSDVVGIMERITEQADCRPERIKVGNGSEFISKILYKWAYESKVELDLLRPGKPADNY